jgi:hypothetical protein
VAQLFGSVTWWMFWPDGWRALAALDDDGDGWLSGAELDGIAVWRDRNQNGVSDPGEVVPAADAGIVRIATHATSGERNPRGVITRGGALPSLDWRVSPVEDLASGRSAPAGVSSAWR